jgi:nucleoside-diphosphate-sugar epimerase
MTTPQHVVLGGGQIGTLIAGNLAAAGESVAVATRSGRDPMIAGVSGVPVDATDATSVGKATEGAATVYFAIQPAYTNWPAGFPPLVEGVLAGLKGTGRRLVVVDNLYMYGPTAGKPIVETLPYAATTRKGRVRAAMATRLLAADAAGDVRVTIGRGSDFFGPGAIDTATGGRFFPPLLAGKAAEVYGDPSLPHTYTYAPDFARALIELGRHDKAFGRAWHVPNAPTVSTERLVDLAAAAAGVPAKSKKMGKLTLRLASLFVPEAREMIEMAYEFEEPFIVDDSAFRAAFALEPTPLETSLAETIPWWREREGVKG